MRTLSDKDLHWIFTNKRLLKEPIPIRKTVLRTLLGKLYASKPPEGDVSKVPKDDVREFSEGELRELSELDVRELPEHQLRELPKGYLRLIFIDPALVGHPVRKIVGRILFEDPPTPSQLVWASRNHDDASLSVAKPASDQTPTSKSLRNLLHTAGVNLDKVELFNWEEILRTAKNDVLDYELPTQLVPG